MDRSDFSISFKETELIGDTVPAKAIPDVLFLHGAGLSDRSRYDYLRLPLAKDGISSASFDFIGHGETGGELLASSLAERTDQATTVIDTLLFPRPLAIVAASMSAYTAIKLTEQYEVDRLVLLVPGVYREDVYTLPFGEEFKTKLREPNSWEQSDAWEILETYTGKLVIISAEKDDVVPVSIAERIYNSARNATTREHRIIDGAPHRIQEFLTDPKNKDQFDECYELIRSNLSV